MDVHGTRGGVLEARKAQMRELIKGARSRERNGTRCDTTPPVTQAARVGRYIDLRGQPAAVVCTTRLSKLAHAASPCRRRCPHRREAALQLD